MEIRPSKPPGGLLRYQGPAAWTGAEMTDDESWLLVLSLSEIEEIEAAMHDARACGADPGSITREKFPLPALSARMRDVRHELEDGKGFVLMRGLPLRRYSLQDAQLIFAGLGAHLGKAVSQNAAGERMTHVTTVDSVAGDPHARGYMKPVRAEFHTDTSDVVALMCWRKAKRGGESFVASAMTVHNIMLDERPDLLEVLYEPFFLDKKNEELPGDDPYYRLPVYSWHEGKISTRYSRGRTETGQRFADVPRLTDVQTKAMDYLDGILEREGVCLAMDFQVGDIQWLNNYVTFHARNAYEDYTIAGERRHLLRLWLAVDGGRELPESFLDVYHGDLAPGRRGGIPRVS